MSDNITDKKVWTTKQLISIVSFVVIVTFSATMIWGRFIYNEAQLEAIDNRYRKITDRIIKDQETQWNVINDLQKGE